MTSLETSLLQDLLTTQLDLDLAKRVLKTMMIARFSDEKMAKLVRQNKGATFHLPIGGHEMIGAISAHSLIPKTDWAYPYYRDRSFAIGLGCSLIEIFGAFLARDIRNHSGGRMMPDHFSDVDLRIPCQSSVVASQYLQAVGTALSIQMRGVEEVVYVSGGDGSTSEGDFHEALNFACIHQLPIVFVIQDNGWAISVPLSEQTAGSSIAKIGQGYIGLHVAEIDGCDFIETSTAMKEAVLRARNKEGPSLIVAKIPRMGAHSSSDDPKKYKDEEVIAKEIQADPVSRFIQWLLDHHVMAAEEFNQLKEECLKEIEQAATLAEAIPTPSRMDASSKVFKPFAAPKSDESKSCGESIVIMDALNHALIEEMEKDVGVVVFGQDVAGKKGGVFGITRTLTDRFGKSRCFNTPLAESTIIGMAIGLSLDGVHKPVVEIQFADYCWTGINQIFNELSSFYYRSNGEWNCPVVIRMPCGGYIQGGPYHSQSIEAFLAHCPGLKIAIPSNAEDAKKLLKTAILDPNPVIFLEHKGLYRQRVFCARPESGSEEYLEFGKANIVRIGSDVTIVTWGNLTVMAFEVAEILASEEISIEVIDLRTIVPLDFDTILQSVKKTGKLLIAHEAALHCGFGAEIAAKIASDAFSYLDAPIVRIGSENCPVPYCKELEEEVLPQKKDLIEALRKLSCY